MRRIKITLDMIHKGCHASFYNKRSKNKNDEIVILFNIFINRDIEKDDAMDMLRELERAYPEFQRRLKYMISDINSLNDYEEFELEARYIISESNLSVFRWRMHEYIPFEVTKREKAAIIRCIKELIDGKYNLFANGIVCSPNYDEDEEE